MENVQEDLQPEETQLIGMWLDLGSKVVGDAVNDRVLWLAEHRLTLLQKAADGFAALYRDPRDGRLWEMCVPFPGGPAALMVIDKQDAATRYGIEE